MKYTKTNRILANGKKPDRLTVRKWADEILLVRKRLSEMNVDEIADIPDYYIKDVNKYREIARRALYSMINSLWSVSDSLK